MVFGKYIMKKIIVGLFMAFGLLSASKSEKETLHVGISPDAPPFEYEKNNELLGFDVDLIQLIAKELDVNVEFHPMSFGGILGALQMDYVEAAISSFEITKERANVFDFSIPYYVASTSAIFMTTTPIKATTDLARYKIGSQLGSTFEKFAKARFTSSEIISMDTLNQLTEALKAGHVDTVVLDTIHADIITKENCTVRAMVIPEAKGESDGYGIVMKKGSRWKVLIDKAIQSLEKKGEINKLQDKWLKDTSWKNS
jgi:ABC-type amino acid transport substrate-binding protein